jgi:hypothetical protein
MRCINSFINEDTTDTIINQQIIGTQSLNRNLCSRLNNNNNNSTPQSPHIIHTSRSSQSHAVKSATLRSHDTTISCNSHIITTTPTTSLIGIDTQPDDQLEKHITKEPIQRAKYNNDNDSSTHGSRTIDSRYSRERMLVDNDDDDENDSDDSDCNDIDNINEDNIKTSSSFNKLPKFKQQEKLKNNIEQINNALKKDLSLNNSSRSSPVAPAQTPPIQQASVNVNMNKIYSRKEVVTIKEDIKNVHHEEYQQTIYQQPYYLTSAQNQNENQNDRLKFYNTYEQQQQQQQQVVKPVVVKRSSLSSSPPATTSPVKTTKLNNNADDGDDGKAKLYFNTFKTKSSLNAILLPIKYPSLVAGGRLGSCFESTDSVCTSTSSTVSKYSLSLVSSSVNFSSSASISSSTRQSSSSSSSLSLFLLFQQKQIASKPKSLPRMRKYVELIEISKLPAVDSCSYQDDTIDSDCKLHDGKFNKKYEKIVATVDDYKKVADKFDLMVNLSKISTVFKPKIDNVVSNNDDDDDDDVKFFKDVEFSSKICNLSDDDDIDENNNIKKENVNLVNISSFSSISSTLLNSPTESRKVDSVDSHGSLLKRPDSLNVKKLV